MAKTIFHHLEPISVEEARRKVIEFQNSYPTLAEYAKWDSQRTKDYYLSVPCADAKQQLQEHLITGMVQSITNEVDNLVLETIMDAAQKRKGRARLLKIKPKTLVARLMATKEALKQRDAKIGRLERDEASLQLDLTDTRKQNNDYGNRIHKILALFPMLTLHIRTNNPVEAIKYQLLEQADRDRLKDELIERLKMLLRMELARSIGNVERAEETLSYALEGAKDAD